MFELMHYLHVGAGVVWAGTIVATVLVWRPAMLALEPDSIGRYFRAAGPRMGRVMAWSGILVILTGLARAYLGGRLRSPSDILSPYGLFLIAALAIIFGMRAYGSASMKPVVSAMAAGADPRPAIRKAMPVDIVVMFGGVLVLVAMMILMGLGRV